jgi:hypothetical protein
MVFKWYSIYSSTSLAVQLNVAFRVTLYIGAIVAKSAQVQAVCVVTATQSLSK